MVQYAIVLGVIMKKNINKLVRYYCTKIDCYNDTHFKGIPVSDSTREKIIKSLKIIIEKDREYLLTDSLLDFCTFYGDYDLEIHLHYLSGDYTPCEVIGSVVPEVAILIHRAVAAEGMLFHRSLPALEP